MILFCYHAWHRICTPTSHYIKLDKLARTTPEAATRSPKSAATLARELGVALTTIYKWKRAGRVHDGSHVRHQLHASTSPEQEALIAELRTQLRLSLDDVTEVMNRCSATPLSRSAIHRCLVRLGVVRSPRLPRRATGGAIRGHPLRLHSSGSESLSQLQKQPSYVFVAIDRATRHVWVKVLARRTAATVTQAVEEFLAAFPQKVHTILTDNDGAFTDRFAVHKKGKPAGHRRDASPGSRVPGAWDQPSPDPALSSADQWHGGTL